MKIPMKKLIDQRIGQAVARRGQALEKIAISPRGFNRTMRRDEERKQAKQAKKARKKTMKTLSTGQPSTLGNYRKLCCTFFGLDSKATQFIDQKIAESPNGEMEEVIADEEQMFNVLVAMAKEGAVFSEKLKQVAAEIKDILVKNDVAGIAIVYENNNAEYLIHAETSKSLIKVKDDTLVFSTENADSDNKEQRDEKILYSVGMLRCFIDVMSITHRSIVPLYKKISEKLEIEHTNPIHTPR